MSQGYTTSRHALPTASSNPPYGSNAYGTSTSTSGYSRNLASYSDAPQSYPISSVSKFNVRRLYPGLSSTSGVQQALPNPVERDRLPASSGYGYGGSSSSSTRAQAHASATDTNRDRLYDRASDRMFNPSSGMSGSRAAAAAAATMVGSPPSSSVLNARRSGHYGATSAVSHYESTHRSPSLGRSTSSTSSPSTSTSLPSACNSVRTPPLASSSLSASRSRMPRGPSIPNGLSNLGNTCFMNSILQCLANTRELAIPFLDGSYAESGIATNVRRRGGSIAHAFSALLKQLVGPDAPSNSVVTPRAFLSCIGAWDKRFTGGAQHDSQEFLHSLLDALQTECNRVKGKPAYKELKGTGSEREQAEEAVGYYRTWQDSLVDDACGGMLQSTITCQRCQHASHCFDPFLDLSVPMPKRKSALSSSSDVDLHACLRTFTETETLDGRDKYMCVKCKSPQPATKRLSIYSFPTILIVHMKRFASSGGGVMSRLVSHQKDSTPVRFDKEGLDLSAYASPAVRSRRAVYDLYAVSNHSGSLTGGHYTAVAKHLKDDQWHLFNDSHVHSISDKSVISSREAYVLFYRLRS